MKRPLILFGAILVSLLSVVFIALAAPAATPIVGGSSFGTAVAITPGVDYSAAISDTGHTQDYFYFNVSPGQIVTVFFTTTTTWSQAAFYLYDQAHINPLNNLTLYSTEQTGQFEYMGNRTTPTRYYFVVDTPGAGTNEYLFRLEVANQSDANGASDAGDTAGTATVITPTLGVSTTYAGNLLGYADTDDYFRFTAASGQIVTITVTVLDYDGLGMLNVELTDQAFASLDNATLYSPDVAPRVFRYISNNSAPSAYYLRFYSGGGSGHECYQFQIELGQQTDSGQTGDAGDTVPTARLITPTLGVSTTYASNLLGYADAHDYFRLNAASGQLITVTVTVLDYGGLGMLNFELTDQASSVLDSVTINAPDVTTKIFKWMSNNSAPSAYYLRFYSGAGNGLERYRFQIELGQQTDAATPGDAGDDFDTARVVTLTDLAPSLTATRNLLGGADEADYFLIKLPPVVFDEPLTPYGFMLEPIVWPQNTGHLTIEFFDALRNPIAGLGGTLTAPSKSVLSRIITNCGSDGCYVHVTSGYTGYYQLQYALRVNPIRFVYLPVIIR